MEQNGKNPAMFFTVGVMVLFLTGFLLLVVFGARSYQNVVDSQYGNMDSRGLSAYIATSVKANDSRGAVDVEDSAYGQVLVVTDHDTGYALRYYRYEGCLVEDFAKDGSPLCPDEAQVIAPMEVFKLEKSPDGLLTVITDAGRTLLSVRSREGAQP